MLCFYDNDFLPVKVMTCLPDWCVYMSDFRIPEVHTEAISDAAFWEAGRTKG